MGVVFGSSEYDLELSFEDLPKKLYDLDQEAYTEDIETYYVYISSHTDEVKAYRDNSEVNLEGTSNTDLDYVLTKSQGISFLSTSSGKPPPPLAASLTSTRKYRKRSSL